MTKENTLVEKVGEHHEQRPHLNFSLFRSCINAADLERG